MREREWFGRGQARQRSALSRVAVDSEGLQKFEHNACAWAESSNSVPSPRPKSYSEFAVSTTRYSPRDHGRSPGAQMPSLMTHSAGS